MKNLFPGHFPLSEDELSELMQKATFVLDTNVLLNMYRYTEPSRENFFEIIGRLGKRVSIPYQVASEFFDARTKVIQDQNKAIDLMDKAIEDAHNKLKNDLNQFRKHAHVDIAKILGNIGQSLNDAQAEIRKIKEDRAPVKLNDDPILRRLADLLSDNIIPECDKEELAKRRRLADERIKAGTPPGFADKGKPGDKSLGDTLIWFEVLEISKKNNAPVIFVTDDIKDDWWLRVEGQIIGPLPALRQEFHKSTGHSFHMYQAENFIKYAAELLKIPVDEGTLTEAAKVSEDQAKAWTKQQIQDFTKHTLASETAEIVRQNLLEKAMPVETFYSRLRDADIWRANFEADPHATIDRMLTERLVLASPPPLLQKFVFEDGKVIALGEPQHMIISKDAENLLRGKPDHIHWVGELDGFFSISDSAP